MQLTTNFKLKKIDLTDSPPDITVLNFNWDTIDTNLKEALDKAEAWDTFQKSGGELGGPITSPSGKHMIYASSTGLIGLRPNGASSNVGAINILAVAGSDKMFAPVETGSVSMGGASNTWKDAFLDGIGSVKSALGSRPTQEVGQWSPILAYAGGGDMNTDSTGSYYVRCGNVVTCYFTAHTTANSLKADVILIRNLPYNVDKRYEEVGIINDFSGLTSDTSGLTIIRHNSNSTLVVLGYMATNGRSMGQLWGNMLGGTFAVKGQLTYRIG